MDCNLNILILVWQYRFNIYQWTASHLTKSFVVMVTISHKTTRLFILRTIISLLFEPFHNSSLDHLHIVSAISHYCISGGNSHP